MSAPARRHGYGEILHGCRVESRRKTPDRAGGGDWQRRAWTRAGSQACDHQEQGNRIKSAWELLA